MQNNPNKSEDRCYYCNRLTNHSFKDGYAVCSECSIYFNGLKITTYPQMDLNKYDYKRIEQLLEEMIQEENKLFYYSSGYDNIICHADNELHLTRTLRLIKERQLTLKNENGSTSTTVRGNNEEIET